MSMGFGYLLNVKFGFKPLHYAISTLAAILTGSMAMRQILLHIVPGTGSYGDPILGLHLYTWLFLICVFAIIWNMLTISFPVYVFETTSILNRPSVNKLTNFLIIFYIAVIGFNIISSFLECGMHYSCPDDPKSYLILDGFKK